MLVSLSVKNFKSIREAHVRFGPFTCFIGHNGVGKSNLFDAIHFLGALTERDIADAATEVRRTRAAGLGLGGSGSADCKLFYGLTTDLRAASGRRRRGVRGGWWGLG